VVEANGSGTVAGSHRYGDNGQYDVTVTVTDDDGGAGSDALHVTVRNVAPTVDAGNDQSGVDEGALVQLDPAAFTDPGTLDTHSAAIGWGDGTTAAGTVSEANGSGTVSGSHRYGDDAPYDVTVTVTDDDGGAGSDALRVTVRNVAPSVSPVTMQQPLPDVILPAVHELRFSATFSDPGWADTHAAKWTFGDGSTSAGTLAEENVPPDATGTIAAKHTYAAPGTYAVTVLVADDDGGSSQRQIAVTVTSASGAVKVLEGYLTNLPDSALTGNPAARRKAWSNQCGALANTLRAEAYNAAGKILTNLRRLCDGSLGGKAQNDWVSSSEAQASICALIDALREYLETLA
jgi:PKD repeat protein